MKRLFNFIVASLVTGHTDSDSALPRNPADAQGE